MQAWDETPAVNLLYPVLVVAPPWARRPDGKAAGTLHPYHVTCHVRRIIDSVYLHILQCVDCAGDKDMTACLRRISNIMYFQCIAVPTMQLV